MSLLRRAIPPANRICRWCNLFSVAVLTLAVALSVSSPATAAPEPSALIDLQPAALSPTILQGQTTASQQINVRNGASTAPMSFALQQLETWMVTEPNSGTAPPTPESDYVAVRVDYISTGLVPDVYAGQIVVTAPSAANSPQTLPVTLTVRPRNDDFSQRLALAGNTGATSGRNVTATTETAESSHSPLGDGPFRSVWWRWATPGSGYARFTAVGTGFVPVLAAYTGEPLGALTPLARAGTSGNTTTVLTFPVTAGIPYQIALDGYERRHRRFLAVVGARQTEDRGDPGQTERFHDPRQGRS